MRPSWAVLGALLATSAGCARTDHYRLVVEGFTPDQQEQVFRAADEWQLAVPVSLTYETGRCQDPVWNTICVRQVYGLGTVALDGDPTARVDGETLLRDELGYSAFVRISVDTPPGTFRQVMAHELGHAQGLQHHAPGTLMCMDTQLASPTITQDDVDQWRSLR